jgi:hypothetical protein
MLVTELLSSYLTKEDFPRPALGTIAKLTQETFKDDSGASETKWCMHFEEFDRGMILNKTNIRLVASILGNDTNAWMGRQIVIYNDPNVSFGGRTVGGLRLRAPKNQAAAPQPAAPAPAAAPAGPFDDFADDIPF